MIAIWKVTREGYATVLVQDDNLVWTDLMWITEDNLLWLPASQMRPGGDGLTASGPNNIYTSLLMPALRQSTTLKLSIKDDCAELVLPASSKRRHQRWHSEGSEKVLIRFIS
jgi:hypothetical protein